jgi:hypothetical protein
MASKFAGCSSHRARTVSMRSFQLEPVSFISSFLERSSRTPLPRSINSASRRLPWGIVNFRFWRPFAEHRVALHPFADHVVSNLDARNHLDDVSKHFFVVQQFAHDLSLELDQGLSMRFSTIAYASPLPSKASLRWVAQRIKARCDSACGKLPKCSPFSPNSSANSPRWFA